MATRGKGVGTNVGVSPLVREFKEEARKKYFSCPHQMLLCLSSSLLVGDR